MEFSQSLLRRLLISVPKDRKEAAIAGWHSNTQHLFCGVDIVVRCRATEIGASLLACTIARAYSKACNASIANLQNSGANG